MNKIHNKNLALMLALSAAVAVLAGCASSAPVLPEPEIIEIATFPDADGDSIRDTEDSCEYTAKGVLIDSTGCELAIGPIPGLNFDGNDTSLKPQAEAILDRYVDALKRYPELVVGFEGHTDNRGTAASNIELSRERVLSVVRYIVAGGISADRLELFGFGESRPLFANATAEGRLKNRRIEIKIIDGEL